MWLQGDGDPFVDHARATVTVATMLGQLEIAVCTPRILRVRLIDQRHVDAPSYLPPRAWPPASCHIESEPAITIRTEAMAVRVGSRPLDLLFSTADGTALLRGTIAVHGQTDDRDGTSAAPARRSCRFEPLGEQHFYGLGEGGKQFDRLGSARQFWNSHIGHGPGSDIGVPVLVSHRGYGLFFDNTSDTRLVIGRSDGGDAITYHPEEGPLDLYYLAGTDRRGVLGEVATLLGHAPLPPRWALGYLQSTRHFADAAELRHLGPTLRDKGIPCDGLIFLSTYGDAPGWNRGVGHLEFHPDLFAAPDTLLAEVREQGFHIITHEYPVLHEESPLFAHAAARGYLLDEGYERDDPASRPPATFREGQRYVDFSNPEAGAWWWAQHRQLADLGVEGWWLDGGEGPSAHARLHAGTGVSWHNLYDRLRQQAFAGGETADYPDRRVYLLCRSGGAGMQRDGAACWSGDINNTFATLEAQVPLGLNTGLSGIPYWGTDIGGFFHPIPESGEMYARWFQFGCFCPSFRSHGWVWRDHTPWAHGPRVEDICRRYAALRYRLLPYTYTLAWQAHTLGLPLMRPLVLNYPDDPRVWELGSEYLWGDDLLVAPVTREGATSWPVYLPAGRWYDFWTQECYAGPCGVSVDAPLERLPLFVRGGAILPLGPVMQRSDAAPLDEVTLLVYPHERGRFELYEDDGHTNAYRRGGYTLSAISCEADPSSRALMLRVSAPRGDTSVIPPGRSYLWQVRSGPPRRVVTESGAHLPQRDASGGTEAAWWHDGAHFLFIRQPAPIHTLTVELM